MRMLLKKINPLLWIYIVSSILILSFLFDFLHQRTLNLQNEPQTYQEQSIITDLTADETIEENDVNDPISEPKKTGAELYEEAILELHKNSAVNDINAIKLFKKSVERGYALSAYELAKLSIEGKGMKKNYILAKQWMTLFSAYAFNENLQNPEQYIKSIEHDYPEYQKILALLSQASSDDPKVLYTIAHLYLGHDGITKNTNKAIEYLSRAGNLKNLKAVNELVDIYEKGDGVAQDYTKAAMWNDVAISLDDENAKARLAKYYEKGTGISKNKSKAIEMYKTLADNGSNEAQYQLGIKYQNGIDGIGKNRNEAIRLFTLSYNAGNVDAGLALANLYASSANKNQANDLKAKSIYKKLADPNGINNAEAQYLYGAYYLFGRSEKKSPAMAAKWFKLAQEQGYAEAAFALGIQYLYGEGVVKNSKKAFVFLQQASDGGIDKARVPLSWLYFSGAGGEKDPEMTKLLLAESANEGDVSSAFNLAVLLSSEDGIEKNYAHAIKWMTKAALAGHNEAEYNLGYFYAYGLGTKPNEAEALRWLRASCEQNSDNISRDACSFFDDISNGRFIIKESVDESPINSAEETKDSDNLVLDTNSNNTVSDEPEKTDIILQKDPATVDNVDDVNKESVQNSEIEQYNIEPTASKNERQEPTPDSQDKKPEKIRYAIKRGDSLSSVAKRYNVTSQDIMEWNNIDYVDYIKVGQILIIYPKYN